MTKLFFKKSLLIIFLSATALISKAQIGYEYAKYDLGLGGAYNQVLGDVQPMKNTISVAASINYNQTPYANYIFEVQTGTLKGGEKSTRTARVFDNRFTAMAFRGQLQAGELIDYGQSGILNALKNFYLSAGVGYVLNSLRNTNRQATQINLYSNGLDKSNEFYIPARIGYEFKFYNQYNQPSFKVDIGYQVNFDLSDNLDGFTAGRSNDVWSQISINLKFALGGVTSYRKAL